MARILIVGASRGIGLALVKELKSRGHEVFGTQRTPSAELEAAADGVFAADVTDLASLEALADAAPDLDILVCNAGVLARDNLNALDAEAMRRQFEVNSIGPIRTAATLRSKLSNGGKIAIITSRMGSMADNTSGGSYGYRMSKAAVNAAGRSLAMDLQDDGVAVFLLHPGWVQTDMTRQTGLLTVDQSASLLGDRIEQLGFEQTGTFWHADGQALPW